MPEKVLAYQQDTGVLLRGLARHLKFGYLPSFIRRNEFIKNVAILFGGNALAQMITVAAAPVISRLYAPGDFGAMALVNSVLSILSVFVCLRYERAIVLPKINREAFYLLQVCLISTVIVTLVSIFIIGIGKNHLALLFNAPELEAWLWFVPAGLILVGCREAFAFWFSRLKQFSDISKTRVYLSLWPAAFKITAGCLIGPSAFWLIAGNILGFFSASYPLIRKQGVAIHWQFFRGISRNKIIFVLKKFRRFPMYSIWTGLLHEVSQNIPVFMLSVSFSQNIVGLYALSYNILNRPLDMISRSITNVILQRFAELNANKQDMQKVFTKTTLGLAIVGLLPCLILYVWGQTIFAVIFGQKWATAGQFAGALSPWLLMTFIMTPAVQVVTVKQNLGFNLAFHSTVALARVVSIAAAIRFYNQPITSISIFSWVNGILYAFYVGYAFFLVRGTK